MGNQLKPLMPTEKLKLFRDAIDERIKQAKAAGRELTYSEASRAEVKANPRKYGYEPARTQEAPPREKSFRLSMAQQTALDKINRLNLKDLGELYPGQTKEQLVQKMLLTGGDPALVYRCLHFEVHQVDVDYLAGKLWIPRE